MFRSSTSSSDRRQATRFALRVAAFAAPVLALGLAFEIVLFRTGESWPVARVAARQPGLPDALYGRQFLSQQYNLYKMANIRRRSPAIVVVGSSRVMQFRDFLFPPYATAFYNAGGLIQTGEDVAAFADSVRSGAIPRPRVVLLGIDPWWLKPGGGRGSWVADGPSRDAAFRFGEHVQAARSLLRETRFPWWRAFTGEMIRSPAYGYPALGLAALRYGDGERNDGSHLYTSIVLEFLRKPGYRDREEPPIIERVRRASRQFTPAASLDPERTSALMAALRRLRAAGVEVVTFEPPFSSEVLAALDASSPGWWVDYRDRLPDRIRREGFACLSVTSPADFGLDDAYMLDGFHPSEVLDSHLVERFVDAAAPGSLMKSVDLASVRRLRAGPRVVPVAFDPPPTGGSTHPN